MGVRAPGVPLGDRGHQAWGACHLYSWEKALNRSDRRQMWDLGEVLLCLPARPQPEVWEQHSQELMARKRRFGTREGLSPAMTVPAFRVASPADSAPTSSAS